MQAGRLLNPKQSGKKLYSCSVAHLDAGDQRLTSARLYTSCTSAEQVGRWPDTYIKCGAACDCTQRMLCYDLAATLHAACRANSAKY